MKDRIIYVAIPVILVLAFWLVALGLAFADSPVIETVSEIDAETGSPYDLTYIDGQPIEVSTVQRLDGGTHCLNGCTHADGWAHLIPKGYYPQPPLTTAGETDITLTAGSITMPDQTVLPANEMLMWAEKPDGTWWQYSSIAKSGKPGGGSWVQATDPQKVRNLAGMVEMFPGARVMAGTALEFVAKWGARALAIFGPLALIPNATALGDGTLDTLTFEPLPAPLELPKGFYPQPPDHEAYDTHIEALDLTIFELSPGPVPILAPELPDIQHLDLPDLQTVMPDFWADDYWDDDPWNAVQFLNNPFEHLDTSVIEIAPLFPVFEFDPGHIFGGGFTIS